MTKLVYITLILVAIMSISVSVILTNQVNGDVTATGISGFIVNSGNSKVWYQIEAEGLNGVTQAHIHSGKVGENGPVVATLFKGNKDTVNGALVQGSITADKLEGPLKGKSISDLIDLFDDASAYVNVHTETFPDGEIRGQISKGTIQVDVTTKRAHISDSDGDIEFDLTNVNINEITVENQNQLESSQTTQNQLESSQTTQNTLGANQTTQNTLGANRTTEDQLGSSQSTDSMSGMNESVGGMSGTNESMGVPQTDNEIETNPVD
jgi:CHRD domain